MIDRFDDHDDDDGEMQKRIKECLDAGRRSRRHDLPLSSCLITIKAERRAWVVGWVDEDMIIMSEAKHG